jgi:adenosylhomocysteine nucleosidase
MAMVDEGPLRRVAVLAPMPLELDAIVAAFGLRPDDDRPGRFTGQIGSSHVTCTHIGMGPPATRAVLTRMFDKAAPDFEPIDHVMIAGICGGLDPELPVGTVINPEFVIDHASGRTYRHSPPGGEPVSGKLVTTEGVTLDPDLSRRFFEQGCVGVDMETSAVADVCEKHGGPWSVYRCIGDRIFDGLLDGRVLAMTNPDGSADLEAMGRLLAENPDLGAKLARLGKDTIRAADLAAHAAVRACQSLDGKRPGAD